MAVEQAPERRPRRLWRDNKPHDPLAALRAEDQMIEEFIVTIVTKGLLK